MGTPLLGLTKSIYYANHANQRSMKTVNKYEVKQFFLTIF